MKDPRLNNEVVLSTNVIKIIQIGDVRWKHYG